MINLQMLIPKNTFNVLSSGWPFEKRTQQCLPRFIWRELHCCTCESLGSGPVKMSQVFHDPLIFFNFFSFHRKVNTFKTPEMCLYLDLEVLSRILSYFCGIFFINLSCFIAGSCSVKMSQAFHNPSINFHHT